MAPRQWFLLLFAAATEPKNPVTSWLCGLGARRSKVCTFEVEAPVPKTVLTAPLRWWNWILVMYRPPYHVPHSPETPTSGSSSVKVRTVVGGPPVGIPLPPRSGSTAPSPCVAWMPSTTSPW